MSENYDIIPKAPVAPSMLPRATQLNAGDLIILTQPGNPIGQKSKTIDLDTLKDFIWGVYENMNRTKVSTKSANNISGGVGYEYLDIPLIEVPPGYCVVSVDLDIQSQDEVSTSSWDDVYFKFDCGVGTYSPVVPGDYTRKYPIAEDRMLKPAKVFPLPSLPATSKPHFFCHFTPNYKNETDSPVVLRILANWNLPGFTDNSHWSYRVSSFAVLPQDEET